MSSEEKIIRGCKAGKRSAYSLLYKTYASTMFGICARYSKNRAEAEDVLQEGFIKVFSNIGKFRSEGSFEGWMKRIMVNTAINNYQKNQKLVNQQNYEDMESVGELMELSVNQNQQEEVLYSKEEMQNAVLSLPEGYKVVFNLYAMEGCTHKEIAEMLNISESTSKTQLFKARKYIIKVLNKNKEKIEAL